MLREVKETLINLEEDSDKWFSVNEIFEALQKSGYQATLRTIHRKIYKNTIAEFDGNSIRKLRDCGYFMSRLRKEKKILTYEFRIATSEVRQIISAKIFQK